MGLNNHHNPKQPFPLSTEMILCPHSHHSSRFLSLFFFLVPDFSLTPLSYQPTGSSFTIPYLLQLVVLALRELNLIPHHLYTLLRVHGQVSTIDARHIPLIHLGEIKMQENSSHRVNPSFCSPRGQAPLGSRKVRCSLYPPIRRAPPHYLFPSLLPASTGGLFQDLRLIFTLFFFLWGSS